MREKLPEIYTIVRRVKIQYTVKDLPLHLPPIYPAYPDIEDEGSDCSDYEDWGWDGKAWKCQVDMSVIKYMSPERKYGN